MASLVVIDCASGQLLRVEVGGTTFRRTHIATPIGGPDVLTTELVENFRLYPPGEFAIQPPPQPPLPPAIAAKGGGEGGPG